MAQTVQEINSSSLLTLPKKINKKHSGGTEITFVKIFWTNWEKFQAEQNNV